MIVRFFTQVLLCDSVIFDTHRYMFQIVGAGLFIVGVWVQFQQKDYEAVNQDLFIPVLILISTGAVITIISLVGVAGTLREHSCMLVFVSCNKFLLCFLV